VDLEKIFRRRAKGYSRPIKLRYHRTLVFEGYSGTGDKLFSKAPISTRTAHIAGSMAKRRSCATVRRTMGQRTGHRDLPPCRRRTLSP